MVSTPLLRSDQSHVRSYALAKPDSEGGGQSPASYPQAVATVACHGGFEVVLVNRGLNFAQKRTPEPM